jgi:SAM-dependent methyltransferase
MTEISETKKVEIFCEQLTKENWNVMSFETRKLFIENALYSKIEEPDKKQKAKQIIQFKDLFIFNFGIIDRRLISSLNSIYNPDIEISDDDKAKMKVEVMKRLIGEKDEARVQQDFIFVDDNKIICDAMQSKFPNMTVYQETDLNKSKIWDSISLKIQDIIDKKKYPKLILDFDGVIMKKPERKRDYNDNDDFNVSFYNKCGSKQRIENLIKDFNKFEKDKIKIGFLTFNNIQTVGSIMCKLFDQVINKQTLPISYYEKLDMRNIYKCSLSKINKTFMLNKEDIINAITNHSEFNSKWRVTLPTPQPSGLHIQTAYEIKTQDYYITEKSDGIRSILAVYNSRMTCLITRKWDITFMTPKADGTLIGLFDSELIDVEGKQYINIFDAMMVNGDIITSKTFKERMDLAREMLESNKIPESKLNKKPVIFKVKPIYKISNIKTVAELIDVKNYTFQSDFGKYKNDGLIFTPNAQPYLNSEIYKWKPWELHTIDFKIHKVASEDYICLQVGHSNGDKDFDVIPINSEWQKFMNDTGMKDNAIVECRLVNCMWYPERIREDKNAPNFISIATDNFSLYEERLTMDDLIKIITTDSLINRYISSYKEIDKKSNRIFEGIKDMNNTIKSQLIDSTIENQRGRYAPFDRYSAVSRDASRRSTPQSGVSKESKLVYADLCCGRFGDMHKLARYNLNYIGIDSSCASLIEARKRWYEKRKDLNVNKGFTANFLNFDLSEKFDDDIKEKLKAYQNNVDIVSVQFALHYFFKNQETLDNFMYNVKWLMKDTGVFICTTTDEDTIGTLFLEESIDIYDPSKQYPNNKIYILPTQQTKEFFMTLKDSSQNTSPDNIGLSDIDFNQENEENEENDEIKLQMTDPREYYFQLDFNSGLEYIVLTKELQKYFAQIEKLNFKEFWKDKNENVLDLYCIIKAHL